MDPYFQITHFSLTGLSIFASIVAFQVAFVLLQWFYVRRVEYLYYIGYMVCAATYGIEEFEQVIPFKVFTSFDPNFHWHFHHALPIFLVWVYYHFAISFLELPRTLPELNKWMVRLKKLMLFYCVFELVSNFAGLDLLIAEYIFRGFAMVVVISSAIFIYVAMRNSNVLVSFTVVGAALLLTGCTVTFILMVMEMNGHLLPIDVFHPMLIGFIAELLTFTTGLSYKALLMEKEKVIIQKRYIEEMERSTVLANNIAQTRARIASDLHDDIGSTLGSISVYSEVAMNRAEKNPASSQELLTQIGDALREMIEKMNDIVWSVNPGNDNFDQLLIRMQSFAAMMLPVRNIKINFNVDEKLSDVKLTMEQRKNIFLIFKESVYNIVKYAECKNVNIHIHQVERIFIMRIEDDGKGFIPATNGSHNGNGVKNIRKRAADIKGELNLVTELNTGTSVELKFPV